MKQISTLSLLIFTFCIIGLTGCKKDDPVDGNIQPGGHLGLVTTDTITVLAVSLPGDSFPSNNLANNYLGLLNDQLYGKSRQSLFSQFELNNSVSFTNATADSVILYLYYQAYYGDTVTPQRFKVFEVLSDLPSSGAYSNLSEASYIDNTKVLADVTVDPRPRTPRKVVNDTVPALRIALDVNQIGAKFLSATSTDLATPITWRNFFKGLFIQTADQALLSGKGASLNFDLDDSKLMFYYTTTDSVVTHRSVQLSGLGGQHINQSLHDRSNTRFSANSGNPLSDTLFVLGQGGVKVRLTFPYLANLKSLNPRGKVTVNKAELKLTQITLQNPPFVESREVTAYRLASNGIAGAAIGGSSAVRSSANQYSLNISGYLQEAINGTAEKGVIVKLTNDDNSPERLMFMGGKNIKLVLTLTKL